MFHFSFSLFPPIAGSENDFLKSCLQVVFHFSALSDILFKKLMMLGVFSFIFQRFSLCTASFYRHISHIYNVQRNPVNFSDTVPRITKERGVGGGGGWL